MKYNSRKILPSIYRLTAFAIAGLLTIPAYAQSREISYLVLVDKAGYSSENFTKQVTRAGGSVKFVLDEIGVAFVSSATPGFKSSLEGTRGIQGVAHSVPVSMGKEVFTTQGPASDPGHIGDDEYFYPLQWGLDLVNAPQAWNAGATGQGVRVAVLDGGIDHDNADLVDNINQELSISFMPCVFGMNCDGDVEDWRVSEIGEYYPGPFFNHGTHVAGTIAAADNGSGGIGVAPDAEIVAVKVCTEFDNFCFDEAMLPGIVYAANIGADLINMSIGGLWDRNPSEFCKYVQDLDPDFRCGRDYTSEVQVVVNAYRRAFHYAGAHNTTVVVSAGNSSLDADTTKSIGFVFSDLQNLLSISALGPIGSALPAIAGEAPPTPLAGPETLTYYSNYGRSIIDFAAPGGNAGLLFLIPDPFNTYCDKAGFISPCFLFDLVLSNAPGDYFFWAQGTSMAAPHATGVAAIIIGLNGGDMSPQRLKTAMKRYADDLGQPGHDKTYGDGLLNAGAAAQ